jgi:hypothetical protein
MVFPNINVIPTDDNGISLKQLINSLKNLGVNFNNQMVFYFDH